MILSNEPILFILDLDGTIIGNCEYQVMLYDIMNNVKKVSGKFKKALIENYKSKHRLTRPYFKYFFNSMKSLYPNCLIYVYTASTNDWANFEISAIEKANNIKFNRPIFARDYCIIDSNGNYKKSINKIMPLIAKKNKDVDISNMLIIDNNKVFIDYTNNFILCNTYDFILFQDIWDLICVKNSALLNELTPLLSEFIKNGKINRFCDEMNISDTVKNNSRLLELKYKWLYKKHKEVNIRNDKYKGDTFWKDLANSIKSNKITRFHKTTLSLISK
jgi:hypothetical protein